MLAAVLLSVACSDQTESVAQSDGGRDAGDADTVPGDVEARSCPADLPGPAMVELATPAGARYCIDRTEVTQCQYLQAILTHCG